MKEIIVKDGILSVVPDSTDKAETIVNNILLLAKNANVNQVKINLVKFNMFTALRVAMLTSAYGLTKNLSNRFEILVSDEVTKAQMQLLSLSNIIIDVERETEHTVIDKPLFAVKI